MSNVLQLFDTVGQSEAGSWLHLDRPDNGEKAYLDDAGKQPLRIKLKGPDSKAWVSFVRKARKEVDSKKSIEETDLEEAQLMARLTLDWENIPDSEGKPMKFNSDDAIGVYLRYKDIRIQAVRFIQKQENFTQGHANS